VFGVVEQVLWPVRAQYALRGRLAETLRLLSDLARLRVTRATAAATMIEVDTWRRRISQKIEDVQALIESSKFERSDLDLDALQARTGDAQIVFVLLLTLARHTPAPSLPRPVRARASEVDMAVATTLAALGSRALGDSTLVPSSPEAALDALERAIAESSDVASEAATSGILALYRSLVASVTRLFPEHLPTASAA